MAEIQFYPVWKFQVEKKKINISYWYDKYSQQAPVSGQQAPVQLNWLTSIFLSSRDPPLAMYWF